MKQEDILEDICFNLNKNLSQCLPKELYHVTSCDSLIKILNSNIFRIKRASTYRNHELELGRNVFRRVLFEKAIVTGTDIKTNSIFDNTIRHEFYHANDVFIGCFSEELSDKIWQRNDVCLVINPMKLRKQTGGAFTKIIYDNSLGVNITKPISDFIDNIMVNSTGVTKIEQWLMEAMSYAYVTKHNRFSWEKEWRIRKTIQNHNCDTLDLSLNGSIIKIITNPNISKFKRKRIKTICHLKNIKIDL